jgi:SAM-dependent methyltransferase
MPSAAQLQMRRNLTQLQAMEGVLNRNGYSLRDFESILDFSCGPARLTQYLPSLTLNAKLFGSEIDEDLIRQAKKTCPSGEFKVSGLQPPFDYPDGKFDFIFSYSVFTSLSEPGHQAWLKEHARVLRPGGVMLHTTHSYENIRRVAMFYPEILGPFQLPEPVDEFIKANRGYYYVPYGPDSPEYGLAILSTDYVAEKWPAYTGLDLVEHAVSAIEGYPSGPQDFVVMAKPKSA